MPGKSKKEALNYVVESASHGGKVGTYSSKSGPAAAAKKAANKRFTAAHPKIRITIRQTGHKRLFTYDATRRKLNEPFVTIVKSKDKKTGRVTEREVVRKYKTTLKAVKRAA